MFIDVHAHLYDEKIEDIKKEFSGIIGKVLSHSENFFGSQKHIRIGGGA